MGFNYGMAILVHTFTFELCIITCKYMITFTVNEVAVSFELYNSFSNFMGRLGSMEFYTSADVWNRTAEQAENVYQYYFSVL